MRWLPWLILWAASATLRGQTMAVTVLTEFRRPGPDGQILAADAVGTPREIISPAIIRNGYTSFHLVVTGPPLGKFMLYIASNPDQVLRPVLYRVTAAGHDKLEPVKGLSESGQFNDKGVGVYWLDIWTPAATPVRRIRLEAQLNMDHEFAITPLELRVQPGSVPLAAAPVVNARRPGNSAASAFALFDQTLCGGQAESERRDRYEPLSISGKILRNAGQDMLLARSKLGAGAADVKAWCAMPLDRGNPESYLRLRDAIWRASQ